MENVTQHEEDLVDVNPLSQFQKEALEDAENELEMLRDEIQKKKYLIDLKKEDITMIQKFIVNDAPWKFTECLGIIEVEKDLNDAVKSGKLYINGVAIEAIYYYMSKVEGKGKETDTSSFTKVEDYIRCLKGITGGLERVKADSEKVRQAEFIVAARREGIEPDESLTTKE